MTEQPPAHDSGTGQMRKRFPRRWPPNWVAPLPAGATARTPRWVKAFGIVGVLVVLLIAVMLLTGHGPGRHMHHGLGGHTTPSDHSADHSAGAAAAFGERRP